MFIDPDCHAGEPALGEPPVDRLTLKLVAPSDAMVRGPLVGTHRG